MEQYTFRQAGTSEPELAAVCELMQTCFAENCGHYDTSYLGWQYRDNPAGQVVGFNAYDEQQRLVAHYATIPFQANYDDEVLTGLLSLNTATHPVARGKGLFVALAQKTYELARDLGYSFVAGVANQNSTPGFIRKLGFQLVAPLDVKAGFGRLPVPQPCRARFSIIRDDSLLQWRLARPHGRYQLSADGRWLLCATHLPLVKVALAHLELAPPDNITVTHSSMLPGVWLGLNPGIDWQGSWFFDLPQRLKPSPLNFIFLNLAGKHQALQKQDICFDALGFDAY